jgi:hypothetical protein
MNILKLTTLLFSIFLFSTAHAGALVCFSSSDPSNLGRTFFEIPYSGEQRGALEITAMGGSSTSVGLTEYNMGDVFSDRNETSIAGGFVLFKSPAPFQSNKYVSITWIENEYSEDMPATITYMDKNDELKINSNAACTRYE